MSQRVISVSVLLASVALFLGGCAENKHRVLTPDERLEQELAEQEAADKRGGGRGYYKDSAADSEEAQKFDKDEANHNLKRATINARDCPNTLTEEGIKSFHAGTATLQIVFQNDGTVKQVTMDSSYADTPVGACVSRAIESVAVKPFVGSEETIEWKVELKRTAKAEGKGGGKPGAKGAAGGGAAGAGAPAPKKKSEEEMMEE